MKQSPAGMQQLTSPQALMPPPAPRPKKQVVLEEDVWTESVERIIERDFFPDLPKLRNKRDWLEAVNSGDPEKIRDAQLRIQERQLAGTPGSVASASTPSVGVPSDSNASTPLLHGSFGGGVTPLRNQGGSFEAAFLRQQTAAAGGGGGGGGDGSAHAGTPNMRLDEFTARYTSEDNASFLDLVEKDNERKQQRALVQYAEASQQGILQQRAQLMLEGPRQAPEKTDGYGSSNQPYSTLVIAPQQAKNQLFFFKEGVPMSTEERAAMVKGPDKAINNRATRFLAPPPLSHEPGAAAKGQGMAAAAAELAGAPSGFQDVMRTPGAPAAQGGVTRGFGFVATPSPAPGVDESPFITWGRMDATPVRLDPMETPVDIGGREGTAFTMKPQRARDRLAQKLGKQAGQSLRHRASTTIGKHLIGVSPSPIGRRLPGTPGAGGAGSRTPLSDAGRKLLAAKVARAGGLDQALRASYRKTPAGTPLHTPGATPQRTPAATPLRGSAATPSRAQGAAGGSSSAAVGEEREGGLRAAALRAKLAGGKSAEDGATTGAPGSLTDNLLDI